MFEARSRFIRSFRSLRHGAVDPALVDLAANRRNHNSKAGILRNGLTVVAFATLEHFIRQRSAELIRHLSDYGPRFSRMSDNFRQELTSGVMEAVRFQAGIAGRQGEDVPSFIVRELKCFANYSEFPTGFTGRHFGSGKANLGHEDIRKLLRLFEVTNGWQHVQRCSQRIGTPLLAPEAQYLVAAQRRHKAAHDPAPSVTSNDLAAFVEQSLVLGCCFDIVATHGVRTLAQRLQPDRTVLQFNDAHVLLRFIDGTDTGYREVVENGRRAAASGRALGPLVRAAVPRSLARGEALIVRSRALRVRRWVTPL
jgi:hypothetical protein